MVFKYGKRFRFAPLFNKDKFLLKLLAKAHMSGRNIWIFFEAPQQYIRHINPWKKCSNLM